MTFSVDLTFNMNEYESTMSLEPLQIKSSEGVLCCINGTLARHTWKQSSVSLSLCASVSLRSLSICFVSSRLCLVVLLFVSCCVSTLLSHSPKGHLMLLEKGACASIFPYVFTLSPHLFTLSPHLFTLSPHLFTMSYIPLRGGSKGAINFP